MHTKRVRRSIIQTPRDPWFHWHIQPFNEQHWSSRPDSYIQPYESKKLSNLEASLELPLSSDNLQRRFDLDGSRFFNKKGGHLNFRKKLAAQLMAHSFSSKHTSPIDGFGVRTNLQNHVVTSTNACNGVCVILSQIAKECKACLAQGRTAQASGKRMVMQELSVNSVRIKENGEKVRRSRPPRTRYDSSLSRGYCWEEHILLTIKA